MIGNSEEKSLLLGIDKASIEHTAYNSLSSAVNRANCGDEVPRVQVETAKYVYRWYICMIFSLFGLMQGAVWNTWSPINLSAQCSLGFSTGDIELLANWGPITFLISMPFIMWLMDRKGLRLPTVLSALLVALGTGLRCLPLAASTLRYFIHAGQFFNGIAGCAVMAAPTVLSNAWFPPEERVTATSITTLFNYFGTGFAYIIGPRLVMQPSANFSSNTSLFCSDLNERNHVRQGVMHLMYFEFGVSLLIFLSILAYFPSHPPKPPSASASITRMDFFDGMKELRHQRTFLIVAITYALVIGGYSGWTGVFSVLLEPLGVSQDEAGKIGFYMTLIGCVVGLVIGWFADRFRGHIKLLIIVLFAISFLAYLYFISMADDWIHVRGFESSKVGIWITCIVIGISMNAAVPLGMEMGADAAYPTSEATSASIIVWLFNLLSFVFVLVLQVTDPSVPNYLMVSFIGVSIPLMAIFAREPSNRWHVDQSDREEERSDSDVDYTGTVES